MFQPDIALYNNPSVVAAAIVTVIAAVGSVVVTIINAKAAADYRKQSRNAREILQNSINENTKKTDVVIEKAVEIHTLTNSNLSKVTASLEVALAKITGLEKLVTELTTAKRIADDLAITKETKKIPGV